MTILSNRDSCTGTSLSRLSSRSYPEDDEMYTYVVVTEHLLLAKRRDRITPSPIGSGDKNTGLPLRRSLFAHVPPYIIFQNSGTTKLPTEITKHLLWWRAKGHNPEIVSATVAKSGFRTTNEPKANWCGTWCSSMAYSKVKYTNLYSKVNHFPSSLELGNKEALWKNYSRMRKRFGSRHFDYMPLTFVLPDQRNSLKRYMQRSGGFWIVKPPNSCAGRGIKIVSQCYEVPQGYALVVQRYISRPKLINGIKFDIRLYVLLTSVNPLRIYVYKEGLVRLATIKYVGDVSTLSERFMHLTNTSVNKTSPSFVPNDDPNTGKGNMWSLNCLWKYLATMDNASVPRIWSKIKDIAVKTIVSAEAFLASACKKASTSTYNYYQLFGFDVLLDEDYRPWLLEVNNYPSMSSNTPLCKIIKGQLAKDYLNLVGFHVPNLLTSTDLRFVRMMYKEDGICYNRQLYTNGISWEDRKKQYCFAKNAKGRRDYLTSILRNLSPDDVRVLIRHEDEISQAGSFEKVFPTSSSHVYLRFFKEARYYNLLLDAWENEYANDRSKGIERLRRLCEKKYHLS